MQGRDHHISKEKRVMIFMFYPHVEQDFLLDLSTTLVHDF